MIDPPALDPRDEDEIAASVIDSLPDELSDRNDASTIIKIIEAIAALYGLILYQLNRFSLLLELWMLRLLGITPEPATPATVSQVVFSASPAGAFVPAGTIVKTDTSASAIKYATDADLTLAPSASDGVSATCTITGSKGRVGAGKLVKLEAPILGVVSVTNPLASAGGADEEPLDAMRARAPLEQRHRERAITNEDFELFALRSAEVIRARALADPGVTTVHIVTDDFNARYADDTDNATDEAIRVGVRDECSGRAHGGVVTLVDQPIPRLVYIHKVEAELVPLADAGAVRLAMLEALEDYITIAPLYDASGAETSPGWAWGASLYLNEVVALLDRIEGVDRIGDVHVITSDDNGTTWSASALLVEIAAARNGTEDPNLGLLQWREHTPTFTLEEL